MLIKERGLEITTVMPREELVDFYVVSDPVLRPRQGRVRLVFRAATSDDVHDLAAVIRDEGLSDGALIESAPSDLRITDGPVQLVTAAELAELVVGSALVTWSDGRPLIDFQRASELLSIGALAAAHDPLGLRWLPTLALNRVPPELQSLGVSAERLLERLAFRVLTTVFRFAGFRLGESRSGERAPDAVLLWPCRADERLSALLDCKAAGSGYTMDSSDERAFTEYVGTHREMAEKEGHSLTYLIVLSGEFGGDFDQRRDALARSGIELVYLRASALVQLALEVEAAGLDPQRREGLDWRDAFSGGRPTADDLRRALSGAGGS